MIIIIITILSVTVDLSTKMADPESKPPPDDDVQAWKDLFDKLVKDPRNSVIEISDLEEAVKGINSRELRADYNLQDYQLKR